ncbi:alpha-keto acid decarboxylase family protein [Paenibacillus agricola]|uniref:Alpha-keto-acid decarboxylase n=1 Tax=Paenibacillus agricola TaxID=2716264 RepID=A0ABX0J4Z2_9BACL|nr:thiamine pyrophosphate-binding protein [Paenibacillus agricola]NHN31385.1 alpha-keto acid decarboxylase family protein [Paenibacillus agricola]
MVQILPPQMQSAKKTLGQYLFDCLKQEGITEIFGVPGDYNFSLLDTLEKYEGIQFINGRNELNSGYAADSYARIKGIGALITTFGVGEMSACNAIAGAYSEEIPLIHIVGSPKSMDQQAHKLMHHTLMDGDYDIFRKVYEHITSYTAILTPENAEMEIPAAIRMAKQKKKPVYLVVAIDLVMKPVIPHNEMMAEPTKTNENSLQAATTHVRQLLGQKRNAVIMTDMKVLRYGLETAVQKLAEQLNVPVASMMQGKGAFDESHPQYIGMYGGAFASGDVRRIVENADCIIAVGLLWSDSNTAAFTAKLNPLTIVDIQPNSVKIGDATYSSIRAEDMLNALQTIGYKETQQIPAASFPYDTVIGKPEQLIGATSYYPRFQRMLKNNDIVVVETGTFVYGMSQIRLPKGATYIAQAGWQSIGYATPAAFGACIAAANRRVLLFTGDGSLQLTAQEISSMLENGCKPIIFVLNNKVYAIEKYLNVKTVNQKYNQVPHWKYTKLVEAFGGQAFTAEVRTNHELEDAIAQAEIQNANKLCIIEMLVHDPMDAPDYLHKMRSYLEDQEKRMHE